MKPNNYAHYWCSIMIEGLIRKGVDHFFIGPGSRSTPLVSALARHQHAKVFLGIDERSVAFMALGYSKSAQKPGVVVVTSGTAVANLYPAVVEAFLSEVPMMILTADRPYELRDCGANQTMFQANMFANHINKSFDLAPPSPVVPLNLSWATFLKAYRATSQPKKGPVHLNIQLREPVSNIPHPGETWAIDTEFKFLEGVQNYSASPTIDTLPPAFLVKKGILAIGEMMPDDAQEHIVKLSEKLNWPIYADVTSNLRFSAHKNILHHFDVALLNEDFQTSFVPEAIIKLGGRIVSKRFWSFVERQPFAQRLSIGSSSEHIDHIGFFPYWQVPDVASALNNIVSQVSLATDHRPWFNDATYSVVTHQIENFLETNQSNEAYYAARLIAAIPEPSNLFLSSSMPIRDVDQFARPTLVPLNVYANRGASGIDGVISSAVGVSKASSLPTVLLIGDVAFIHDTNGLMLVKAAVNQLLIVVFNNGGGGIFHFLPIAKEQDVITPYLDTPHQVSIKALCQAHQVEHEVVHNTVGFTDAIKRFYEDRTTRVLEVVVDRDANVLAHKQLYQSLLKGPSSTNPVF